MINISKIKYSRHYCSVFNFENNLYLLEGACLINYINGFSSRLLGLEPQIIIKISTRENIIKCRSI